MITIYDIAKKTGFSASTVSRALNSTGSMKSDTRQKILEVAKSMGYETNMTAKALITKKSYLIGAIFEDTKMRAGFEHPLFGGIMTRFRSKIESSGYDLIFLSRNFSMSYLSHARFRGVDGIVIVNPNEIDFEVLKEIGEEQIPCVSTNDFIPGVPTVLSDNQGGAYRGTEYLLSMGHTKICFLAGPFSDTSRASNERYLGFRQCLEDKNIPFNESYFEECDFWTTDSGYKGFANLLSRNKDFTAVFCANDMIAFGVMEYAKDHNINVPDELSIITFDNVLNSSVSKPGLTTFIQDRDTIADVAAEILMYRIAGVPHPSVVRIPVTFEDRGSVKKIE